jgi:hypothetical protein
MNVIRGPWTEVVVPAEEVERGQRLWRTKIALYKLFLDAPSRFPLAVHVVSVALDPDAATSDAEIATIFEQLEDDPALRIAFGEEPSAGADGWLPFDAVAAASFRARLERSDTGDVWFHADPTLLPRGRVLRSRQPPKR